MATVATLQNRTSRVASQYGTDFAAALADVEGSSQPNLDIDAELTLPGRRNIKSSIWLRGVGGRLLKSHSSIGLQIEPDAEALGTTTGTPTATELQIAGASWTTNEHVGKWIEIQTATTQYMRCVANNSNTLELEYALDVVPGTGVTVQAYTPIPEVVLDGFEFDGTGSSSGAGIRVRFVDWLYLLDIDLHNHAGNGLSAYFCNHIRAERPRVVNNNFGLFFYHSDDALIEKAYAEGNTGEYGVQLKDCRNSAIISPHVKNCPVGADIKCSGLYPAFNLSIVGGTAEGCTDQGFKAHGLVNEGTTYFGQNFQIIDPQAIRCGTGVQVLAQSAGGDLDVQVLGGQIRESTSIGLAVQAQNARIRSVVVRDGNTRACEVDRAGVSIRDCLFANNHRSGAGGEEMRLTANADNCEVQENTFEHSDAGSGSLRAINEQAGATGNRLGPNRIIDSAGGYASDYSLASAVARGRGEDYVGSFNRNAIMEFVGAGDPSGTVAAPVGSTYRRTDGGAGTTLYVKESGTGNTGWAAI